MFDTVNSINAEESQVQDAIILVLKIEGVNPNLSGDQ